MKSTFLSISIINFEFHFDVQENLISDDLDLDDRSLKEPIAGTSRSMQDMDASQMITDDGFGGSSFGREYSIKSIRSIYYNCHLNDVYFDRGTSCWSFRR